MFLQNKGTGCLMIYPPLNVLLPPTRRTQAVLAVFQSDRRSCCAMQWSHLWVDWSMNSHFSCFPAWRGQESSLGGGPTAKWGRPTRDIVRYEEGAPTTSVSSGRRRDQQGVSGLRTRVQNVEGHATPAHRAAAGRSARTGISPPSAGYGAASTSLWRFLEDHPKDRFPLSRKTIVLHQVALGLAYLHSLK